MFLGNIVFISFKLQLFLTSASKTGPVLSEFTTIPFPE